MLQIIPRRRPEPSSRSQIWANGTRWKPLGWSRCIRSILGEVVLALVRPGRLLGELHQEVVGERGGAEAEEVGGEPGVAQRFLHQHEHVERLLRRADAAR